MSGETLPKFLQEEIASLRGWAADGSGVLIEALHRVQARLGGVPEGLVPALAAALVVSPERVREVLTFYSMFSPTPLGKHLVCLCGNLPCWLRGSEAVRQAVELALGVRSGETRPDGLATLQRVECLGLCDHAPAMQLDGVFHGDLTPEKATEIIQHLLDAESKHG